MYTGFYVKCLLFLSTFNHTWVFTTDFSETSPGWDFLKICPAGEEFCADRRTDGHTDMMKLTVTFRNFANEHKKNYYLFVAVWRHTTFSNKY